MKKYFETEQEITEMLQQANKKVGSRLRSLRKGNQTQSELAKELEMINRKGNVSKSKISEIETGKKGIYSGYLPILADKYNTTVESFFNDDKVFVLSENVFYQLISSLKTDDDSKINATKYMSHITDNAIKNVGAEKLFDILYTVIREASFGNTNGMSIGADIDAINRVHQQNEGRSMYLEDAVTYAKELMDKS